MGTGLRCGRAALLAACVGLLLGTAAPSATGAQGAARSGDVPAAVELFALESELGDVQAQLDRLAGERRRLADERAVARERLRIAGRALHGSQLRLARLVHRLYRAGEPEPLAVLLGAESLDEAGRSLDALGRAAQQHRRVASQARTARADAARLARALAARDRSLASVEADARRRSAALTAVVERRRAYLAELARRESVARADEALRQAAGARERAATLTAAASSDTATLAASEEPETRPVVVRGVRQLTVDAVAYSLPGNTASGLPVGPGVVAVDPTVIPLGTRLYVPGYGPAVAADVGSAVKGLLIDLWFPTLAEARAWGRRTVTITLR